MSTDTDTDTASVEALAGELDRQSADIAAQHITGWGNTMSCASAALRTLAAERDSLKADNANLRTVMVAAAEEIHTHWQAHCDADGYGPANLMHRLEQGIPSQYGYTAGRFAELVAERDSLRQERDQWRSLYRRAVNEANGLTNYVEDRPELRRAERNLTAIETEARSLAAIRATTPQEPT